MARKVTIPGQNVPIQIGGAINPDWYEKLKFLETLQPLSDVDFAAIDAAIALKSDTTRTINPQTGTSYVRSVRRRKDLRVLQCVACHGDCAAKFICRFPCWDADRSHADGGREDNAGTRVWRHDYVACELQRLSQGSMRAQRFISAPQTSGS